MKIYGFLKTGNAKQVLIVAIALPVLMLITAAFGIIEFYTIGILTSPLAVLALTLQNDCGIEHYRYLDDKTVGYKYFRSLPNAYKKFRSYCTKVHVVFLVIGGIILAALALRGFTDAGLTVTLLLYMVSFGIHQLICANRQAVEKPDKAHNVIAVFSISVTIGLYKLFFEDMTFPVTVSVIIAVVSFAFALFTLIPFYKKLEANWNNQSERI